MSGAYTAVGLQTAVTAHLKGKQLLLFAFDGSIGLHRPTLTFE